MNESAASPQLRFPHWLVLIGAGLIVLALVLVMFRLRFTSTAQQVDPNVVFHNRNPQAEITLWCFAGVAAVLGIGLTLVGLAKWPEK